MTAPDGGPALTRIRERIRGIESWLRSNGKGCRREQKHLDDGSEAQIYWHFGYMMALKDTLRLAARERKGD